MIRPMSEIIYPRSPRETMCGWMHLPRFIDKLRLQAGTGSVPDLTLALERAREIGDHVDRRLEAAAEVRELLE